MQWRDKGPCTGVAENSLINALGKNWMDSFGGLSAFSSLARTVSPSEQNETENSLENLCEESSEVFEEGFGHCRKILAYMELKQNATPLSRTVPIVTCYVGSG